MDSATNAAALKQAVSLFTREWIEIKKESHALNWDDVSLFTREWIEMLWDVWSQRDAARLPLYEGVD